MRGASAEVKKTLVLERTKLYQEETQAFRREQLKEEKRYKDHTHHRLNVLPFMRKHEQMSLNTARYRDHSRSDSGTYVYGRY